jgi:hypothetical protein
MTRPELGTLRSIGSFNPEKEDDPEYVLIQSDTEAAFIMDFVGWHGDDFQYLLVLVGDGEYLEVWGINGTPYLGKKAELIYLG